MTVASTSEQQTATAASISDASQGRPPMDKIVVAIHGIGSQLRSDTIRSVARRFGDRASPPLPVMPLGYFNLGSAAAVRISRLDAKPADALSRIGFAEIYWADIPGQVVKANDTLEETKAWGHTVVSRAESQYRKEVPNGNLKAEDFQLGTGIVDEIVETVGVLESLLAVLARMGIFKFELAPLLRDYVGDVQLVTDFPYYRDKILHRFHSALAQVVATFQEACPGGHPEIYIVAHSEGTVISFLGLLEALSGRPIVDPDNRSSAPVDDGWIRYVRGYMTIGSPIDKHIVLWPALWQGLKLKSSCSGQQVLFGDSEAPRLTLAQQIKWRNYYDFGDPIGFKLDSAMGFLKDSGCEAFEFGSKHDHGFSRYWLPGKAHNDYWNDSEVFGHFIDDVVLPDPTVQPKVPASNGLVDRVSLAIPYVASLLLHVAAVFLLYKGVTPTGATFDRLPLQILLMSGLMMGITAAARLPRLVHTGGLRWHLAATLVFLIGAWPFYLWLPDGPADFLGSPFTSSAAPAHVAELVGRLAPIAAAALIALSGWLLPRKPNWGRRCLVGVGALVIAFIVLSRLLGADGPTASPPPAAWPVLLAGAAFLYLWWLAILIFDLSFIWHRYIRRSVAVDTMRQWKRGHDARPNAQMGLGAPAAPTSPAATPPAKTAG
ncbi:MFS transporter [Roseateles sp. P5_E4]